jgi:hypothetical protein
MRVPFSPTFSPTFVFLMMAFLTGVKWNLNAILIFISFIGKDVERFSCIYWPFVFLLLKMVQFIFSCINWIVLWVFNFWSAFYILDINPLSDE